MAPYGSSKITLGSVVGRPSGPISASAGICLPALYATRTLPCATREVAMSSTIFGWVSVAGIAVQYGLVE